VNYVACDLCGQDDYAVVLPNCKTLDGPLVRCRHCQLIYVNPRHKNFAVDSDTVDSSARRMAVWEQYDTLWDKSLVSDNKELKHIHANFELRVRRIQKFITTGTLLDIGSGKGHALSVLREAGFKVQGIEPNATTAQFARQEYGLDVIQGVLLEDSFREGSFDVVTMSHLIEHLPSPNRELQKVHRILRTGGYLFIETPRIDSLSFHLLGKRWRQFIPDHYYFFTFRTIQSLLEQRGFAVLEMQTIGKRMSLTFLISRTQRYNKKLSSALAKLVKRIRLGDSGIYLAPGDVMFVTAQKK
jgi:2-polyprenyl-3-methyl-5-hydroxy-6-metoxy-1,4-benzoquinol methylase